MYIYINPYAGGGYFGQYKMIQESWKTTETLANWYSSESTQSELSNEYQHGRIKMVFQIYLHPCILDESSLSIERITV